MQVLWSSSAAFLLLGFCFGVVFAWGAIFEDHAIIKELISGVRVASANEYVLVLMTTFAAAVSASGVLLFIERLREKERLLSEINEAKKILQIYQDNILRIKGMSALPELKRLERLYALYKANKNCKEDVGALIYTASIIKNSAKVPYHHIAQNFSTGTEALEFIIRTQESINTLIDLIEQRVSKLDSLMSISNEKDRTLRILGLSDSEGRSDSILRNLNSAILDMIDFSLYFIHRSLIEIDANVERTLSARLRKRVLILPNLSKHNQNLLPDMDKMERDYLSSMVDLQLDSRSVG